MTIIAGQNRAQNRLGRYLTEAGARAAVSRKVGSDWELVAEDVPVMVGSRVTTPTIDPSTASEDHATTHTFMVARDADVRLGDRMVVQAPRGSGVRPGSILTIANIEINTMAPALAGTLQIEEVAVESYPIAIERWDDDLGIYVEVLAAEAQAVASTGTSRSDAMGASGSTRRGVAILEPIPNATIIPGDSLAGIPWARGAHIITVYPIVGSRLELQFTYNSGTA